MMIKKLTMIVVACIILRFLVKLRFPPENSENIEDFRKVQRKITVK